MLVNARRFNAALGTPICAKDGLLNYWLAHIDVHGLNTTLDYDSKFGFKIHSNSQGGVSWQSNTQLDSRSRGTMSIPVLYTRSRLCSFNILIPKCPCPEVNRLMLIEIQYVFCQVSARVDY